MTRIEELDIIIDHIKKQKERNFTTLGRVRLMNHDDALSTFKRRLSEEIKQLEIDLDAYTKEKSNLEI